MKELKSNAWVLLAIINLMAVNFVSIPVMLISLGATLAMFAYVVTRPLSAKERDNERAWLFVDKVFSAHVEKRGF